ncbi:chlorophyll a/b-binding protein [[Leptolyngbya] sp. PCC 7376]|uniref:chlorophyll a/b-binding protein n=1 Tax=[Leptolyngbya] sp. PCC 7376 TaxID=111781 RepID=UPI0021F8A907
MSSTYLLFTKGHIMEDKKFGFTISAESLNGRMAMIGFVAALALELTTGQGVLHFFGLL